MENMPKPPKEIMDFGVLDRWSDERIQETIDSKGTLQGFLTWSYCYVDDLYSEDPAIREETLKDIAEMVIGTENSLSASYEIEAERIEDVFCAWGDDICVFYRIRFT